MAELQLPPPLTSDERFVLLCELLDERLAGLDLSTMLVYLVDQVPASVLPHLAEQFHVMGYEGWLFAEGDTERRALIKQAIRLHRYKGTPWAIEQALATVLGLDSQVSEWFEYDGSPYRFRVDVDVVRSLSPADHDAIHALVLEYKNKRSRLEALNIRLTQTGPLCLSAMLLTGERTTVTPRLASELQAGGQQYLAACLATGELTTITPVLTTELQAGVRQYHGAGMVIGEQTTVYPHLAAGLQVGGQQYRAAGMATGEITTIHPHGTAQ